MSKKKKKQARRTTSKADSPRAGGVQGKRRSDQEFNPDYSYVIKDLKRIGALAGTFFLALIILSFILN